MLGLKLGLKENTTQRTEENFPLVHHLIEEHNK